MTKFQKDLEQAKLGNRSVVESRIAELKKIDGEGRRCKNSFRMQCLLQDKARVLRELEELEAVLEASY